VLVERRERVDVPAVQHHDGLLLQVVVRVAVCIVYIWVWEPLGLERGTGFGDRTSISKHTHVASMTRSTIRSLTAGGAHCWQKVGDGQGSLQTEGQRWPHANTLAQRTSQGGLCDLRQYVFKLINAVMVKSVSRNTIAIDPHTGRRGRRRASGRAPGARRLSTRSPWRRGCRPGTKLRR
jgi:hypothetical protein